MLSGLSLGDTALEAYITLSEKNIDIGYIHDGRLRHRTIKRLKLHVFNARLASNLFVKKYDLLE